MRRCRPQALSKLAAERKVESLAVAVIRPHVKCSVESLRHAAILPQADADGMPIRPARELGDDGTREHAVRRGDRRRRAGGPGGRDPPPPAQHGARSGDHGLRDRQGIGARRAYALGRGPGAACPRRAAAGLARRRRADHHGRHRGPLPVARRQARDPAADPAADAQCRQLHRQHGQGRAVARRAGGGAGRRDLPGLCRRRGAVPRGWQRQRGRDRPDGPRPRRPAQGQL